MLFTRHFWAKKRKKSFVFGWVLGRFWGNFWLRGKIFALFDYEFHAWDCQFFL